MQPILSVLETHVEILRRMEGKRDRDELRASLRTWMSHLSFDPGQTIQTISETFYQTGLLSVEKDGTWKITETGHRFLQHSQHQIDATKASRS